MPAINTAEGVTSLHNHHSDFPYKFKHRSCLNSLALFVPFICASWAWWWFKLQTIGQVGGCKYRRWFFFFCWLWSHHLQISSFNLNVFSFHSCWNTNSYGKGKKLIFLSNPSIIPEYVWIIKQEDSFARGYRFFKTCMKREGKLNLVEKNSPESGVSWV